MGFKTFLQDKDKKKQPQQQTSGGFKGFLTSRAPAPSQQTPAQTYNPASNPALKPLGGNKYQTPTGSVIDFKPDGSRTVHLAAQFGGGAYEIDSKGQPVRTPRDYAGVPSLTGHDRDHIIPVSLGGISDSKTNIRSVPSDQNPADLETKLAADVKSGKISNATAVLQIMQYKQDKFMNPEPKLNWLEKTATNVVDGVKNEAKNIKKDFIDIVTSPKAVYDMFAHPSDRQKQFEKDANLNEPFLQNPVAPLIKAFTRAVPISSMSRLAEDITNLQEGVNGKIDPFVAKKLIETAKRDDKMGEWARGELSLVANDIKQYKPTAFFGLNQESAGEAVNAGMAASMLYEALSPLARNATLQLAELAKQDAKVPITFKDAQNITIGREDLVKPEVVEAYKKAAIENPSLKEQIKQGYIELSEKNPTALSNIMQNAATRPVSEFAKFTRSYGTEVKPSVKPALTDTTEVNPFETKSVKTKQITEPIKVEVPKPTVNPFEPGKGKYPTVHEGGIVKMVDGEPVHIADGLETFLHKGDGGWIVSETTTGRFIAESRSKEGVIAKAHVTISEAGADKLKATLDKHKLTAPPSKATPTVIEPTKGTSKIAESVKQKAVDQGFTKKLELAGYDKITIKDQFAQAEQLFSNPKDALDVLTGRTPVPAGLNPLSVVAQAEKHIKTTKDIRMLQALANSPLITESSIAGQTLRLAAEREPDSIVAKLQAIKKARSEKITTKRSAFVNEGRKAIKDPIEKAKAAEKRLLDKFLKDITC